MTSRHTRNKLAVTGVALLVVLALGPALTGLASAAPAPVTASASPSAEWAYGGLNGSNGTFNTSTGTITWSASFGIDLIFNATNTSAHTVELSAERTVGLTVSVSIVTTNLTATFNFKAVEVDQAHANLTNLSTVYVGDVATPALGIDNASASAHASLAESVAGSGIYKGVPVTASKYFNLSGQAGASVQFTPALGLIPLNLTGVTAWNSTANATPQAAWNVSYAWIQHVGTTLGVVTTNGSGSSVGSWTKNTTVNLTGSAWTVDLPSFVDHQSRTGISLVISGPADLYDGFILIPHGFDFFGGATHTYDTDSLMAATLSTENLYVTGNHIGARSLSAARATFGTNGSAGISLAVPESATPATVPSPNANVLAQPESPSQAQSQADCLQHGCNGTPAPWFSGLVAVGLILLVVGVAGTVATIEWRSHSRRNSPPKLAGSTGGIGSAGTPPGAPGSPSAVPPGQSPPSPGGPGPGF
ncbi:MAG TPA: hypothetical protein VK455_05910 [Thermoplasmata archaeon]|nr:hypothetical protein [Thermoplasmata archaeon]